MGYIAWNTWCKVMHTYSGHSCGLTWFSFSDYVLYGHLCRTESISGSSFLNKRLKCNYPLKNRCNRSMKYECRMTRIRVLVKVWLIIFSDSWKLKVSHGINDVITRRIQSLSKISDELNCCSEMNWNWWIRNGSCFVGDEDLLYRVW